MTKIPDHNLAECRTVIDEEDRKGFAFGPATVKSLRTGKYPCPQLYIDIERPATGVAIIGAGNIQKLLALCMFALSRGDAVPEEDPH